MADQQSVQAQLRDALARGDKDAVAALLRQGGIGGLLQTLRAVQATAVDESRQAAATAHVPATVQAALARAQPMEAIRHLREANPGMSLAAARGHVEQLRRGVQRHRPPARPKVLEGGRERTPTVVMGDKPGDLRWLFVLIACVALAWWWTTL